MFQKLSGPLAQGSCLGSCSPRPQVRWALDPLGLRPNFPWLQGALMGRGAEGVRASLLLTGPGVLPAPRGATVPFSSILCVQLASMWVSLWCAKEAFWKSWGFPT